MSAAAVPYDRAAGEPAEFERVQVQVGGAGIAGVEHLEAPVDDEAVDAFGGQPPADVSAGFQDLHVAARGLQSRGDRKTGEARSDDDDLGSGR